MIPICLAVFPLVAQTAGQDPVIRISVDLVQMDAVVTDPQGHHVADLKPEDFQILEDGKPQKITHFSSIQNSPAPVLQNARSSEENVAHPTPLRPQDVHRTIVLVADDLSFGPDEFLRVRTVMKEFIDREMNPGDLVSIMTTSGGMGAREQLTNDKRALLASIARIVYSPGRNQFGEIHHDRKRLICNPRRLSPTPL
jgi:VWFA-related protein